MPAVLFRNSGTFKSFNKLGNIGISDIVRQGLQVLLYQKLPGLGIGHIEMPALRKQRDLRIFHCLGKGKEAAGSYADNQVVRHFREKGSGQQH